jgi:hypothetical protein
MHPAPCPEPGQIEVTVGDCEIKFAIAVDDESTPGTPLLAGAATACSATCLKVPLPWL